MEGWSIWRCCMLEAGCCARFITTSDSLMTTLPIRPREAVVRGERSCSHEGRRDDKMSKPGTKLYFFRSRLALSCLLWVCEGLLPPMQVCTKSFGARPFVSLAIYRAPTSLGGLQFSWRPTHGRQTYYTPRRSK